MFTSIARKNVSHHKIASRKASLEQLAKRELFAADLSLVSLVDPMQGAAGPVQPAVYGPIQAGTNQEAVQEKDFALDIPLVDHVISEMVAEGEGSSCRGALSASELIACRNRNQNSDDHANTPTRAATDVSFDSRGRANASGTLERLGDKDVFEISFSERKRLRVDVIARTTGLDTYLRIYDSRGRLVEFDDDSGAGTNSRETVILNRGRYYIEVSAFADRSIGRYSVRMLATDVGPTDDHSNAIGSTATTIRLSSTGRGFAYGNLETNRDTDVFKFRVTGTSRTTINVGQSNSSVDTFLRLYDANGRLIETDDDGGLGTNSRITRTLRTGTYYIRVSSYASRTSGRYSVSVVTTPSTPANDSDESIRFSGSGRAFDSDRTTNGIKRYRMVPPATRSYRMQIQGHSLSSGTVEIRDSRNRLVTRASFSPINNNIRFNATAGEEYSLVVRRSTGSDGTFSLIIQ